MTAAMPHCLCGSLMPYEGCCEPYHTHVTAAPTPEALMRSRYTAFVLGNIDWIQASMKGAPLEGFDANAARLWASSVTWLGLEVLNAGTQDATHGTVEFIARFLERDALVLMHEISEFEQENGRWLYVNGRAGAMASHKKIPLNAACPCGSQRKFKNCHSKRSRT
ncbi:YchJ family protein [Legionella geestiana]|uniref:YchJ family protein n=1 Tax=Legionella geestiana TaxID=45065 RepID=UPI001FE76EBD|nr:YchJ family protein [Legionella geestiana]